MERAARIVIGTSFAAFGVHYVVYRDFVSNVLPKLPAWIPWHPFWAIVFGVAMIAAGMGIALGNRAAAMTMGWACIATLVLVQVPGIFSGPFGRGGALEGPGEDLVYAGTAFLAAASSKSPSASAARDWHVAFFKYAFACFMILCGWLHFVMTTYVASLIPAWIPWHLFWTYFAAICLVAGGVGILIPRSTQPASLLSGVMLLAWVLLVHLPLVLRNPHDPGQSVSLFEALSFGTSALLAHKLGKVPSAAPAFRAV